MTRGFFAVREQLALPISMEENRGSCTYIPACLSKSALLTGRFILFTQYSWQCSMAKQ
jgi:hypothetical protein